MNNLKLKRIKKTILSVLLVLFGLFVSYRYWVGNPAYYNTEEGVRRLLAEHYPPAICPRTPPGADETNISLVKRDDLWQYKVESGRCCTVIDYEGYVIPAMRGNASNPYERVKEESSNERKVPC